MTLKLSSNEQKGPWKGLTREELWALIDGELAELEAAMSAEEAPELVLLEGADVCNYVAMICDNYGRDWARAYANEAGGGHADEDDGGELCGDGTPSDSCAPYPAGECGRTKA